MSKKAAAGNYENLELFTASLDTGSLLLRYWAATGLVILGKEAQEAKQDLLNALNDESPVVRIASLEALYNIGVVDLVVNQLIEELDNDNMMIRVQTLNVLELMGEDARPAFSKIREKVLPREQRSYDNRLMWRIVNNVSI